MQILQVELGDRSYPIYIGEDLLLEKQLLLSHLRGNQALVVTNDIVAPLYLDAVLKNLSGLNVSHLVLPDGEEHKSLQVLSTIYDKLLADKHNRSTTLIALGGGVVGDMTGYAAASYQRGVDFIQIPTTLLSQVDSSVGGKTGVNHPVGKNMIGAFHQPRCVVADIKTLNTLPPRELSAGIAEVIKYGLIAEPGFFTWLEDNIEGLLAKDTKALAYAIEISCKSKAEIVAKDERESGIRAILNLGHTFGHAIETAQGYGSWLHGEAVAVGMKMAADFSQRLGWVDGVVVERVTRILEKANLPIDPPAGMTASQFLSLMCLDKKVLDGQLRLVLLRQLGEAVVTSDFDAKELESLIVDSCIE